MNKFALLKGYLITIFFLLFGLPVFANEIQAVATVSKNILAVNEPFQLSISVNANMGNTNIDLSELADDFHYTSQPRMSNSVSIINGKEDNKTTWRYTLVAKNEGTFTIPAIKVANLMTAPIQIQALPSAAAVTESQQSVQLEASISNESPYIGETFIYTLNIKIGATVNSAALTPPQGDGFEVTQIGSDTRSEKVENGIRYLVFTRQYEIVATKAGDLSLKGAVYQGNQINGYGYNALSLPLQKQSQDMDIQVKAKPENIKGVWLPTSDLQISQEWQPDINNNQEFKVGETISRNIKLKIKNIQQSAMPNLNLSYPDSIRVYEGSPKHSVEDGYSIVEINQVLIPRSEGSIDIMPMSLTWFNTQTEQEETTVLEGLTLKVLLDEQSSAFSISPNSQWQNTAEQTETLIIKDAGFWPWLSAVLASLWLITLLFFWQNKKRALLAKTFTHHGANSVFGKIKESIKTNNIADILWHYQKLDLSHLSPALIKKISNEIEIMKKAHYSASPTQWDSKVLLALIKEAEKQKSQPKQSTALVNL